MCCIKRNFGLCQFNHINKLIDSILRTYQWLGDFHWITMMIEFQTHKNVNTVKPVYNGHTWDLKKAAVWQRCLIKLWFRLVADDSKWPLLTGGCCSQVVVSTGLTVCWKMIRLGEVRSGQVRPGQVRWGQVRWGQVR